MIEVYLFVAMFAVQILGMSVLYPIRLARLTRAGLTSIAAERLAELYPGVDVVQAHERFLARYHAANGAIAVLGLVLLGWFISYTQRPNWDESDVGAMVTAYCMLQTLPMLLISWFTTRFNKVHRRLLREPKRRAVLQRRGLFDFVTPFTALLVILAYFQFAAFMFYVARHPFPGFGGPLANIGIVSLGYIFLGALVAYVIYGRKRDPLQTHADRMRTIRFVVNCYAWMCILVAIFGSLSAARKLLDLEKWGPFASTAFFVALTLLSLRSARLSEQPEADRLRSSPAR